MSAMTMSIICFTSFGRISTISKIISTSLKNTTDILITSLLSLILLPGTGRTFQIIQTSINPPPRLIQAYTKPTPPLKHGLRKTHPTKISLSDPAFRHSSQPL